MVLLKTKAPTGANNPTLRRYVQPDDGLLGKNTYNTDWNWAKPGGQSVCVYAFIGKLADGSIATYQTLPWDIQGWHACGTANRMGYIGFAICEDGLTDRYYFESVYFEAIDLTAYLCKLYNRSFLIHILSIGMASAWTPPPMPPHSDTCATLPAPGGLRRSL